jgi:hypothetical protein
VRFSPAWLILVGVPFLHGSENIGIKIKIRHIFAGNSSTQTIYLQADRKRMELRNSLGRKKADGSQQWLSGPQLAAITRCDLGQYFELNLDAAEYVSGPYPPKPLTEEQIEARGLKIAEKAESEKPTLRIETTTVDTGQRKEIFGYIARHIITTRKQTPLEGSHSEPQEMVTEGWYIDLNWQVSCDRRFPEGRRAHSYLSAKTGKLPAEKPEFVDIGEPETGFALQQMITSKGTYTLPDGARKQTDSKSETLVTQLEEGPLDPALFEIPPEFKHVEHIERNPSEPASSSQMRDFWERFKARVASLF